VENAYLPRLVDQELAAAMTQHPAVLVVGPRACGKTTTARRMCASTLRLDVPSQAAVAHADPDSAIRGLTEPVLIDEWQVVPQILGAVKRAVDDDPRAGRFVLTGSSQADVTATGWPATGRVVRLPMYPLVGRERHGHVNAISLVDRIGEVGPEAVLHDALPNWDLRSHVRDALESGWPEALRTGGERARDRWLTSYVDHMATREIGPPVARRDPVKLRRYLRVLAANTAGSPTHKLLYDAAEIDRLTAIAYDDFFDTLMITQRVPAWAVNRTDRAVRIPKRHLIDPGLAGALLRADERQVMRDGDLLGRLLDTYVTAQIRAECAISSIGADLFHMRDPDGRREIDLIVEARDGRVIALELKATAAPAVADARHLAWLRDRIGQSFIVGLVVHTGPRAFVLGDRLLAVPISGLWQG